MINDEWTNKLRRGRRLGRTFFHFSFQISHLSFVCLFALSIFLVSPAAKYLPTDARAATRNANSPRVPFLSSIDAPETSPRVEQVAVVGMTVSDMDASVSFYSKVLSFEKVSDVELAGED